MIRVFIVAALLMQLLLLRTGAPHSAQTPSAVPIAIIGATLVDGTGAEPRQADVLIRADRIEAVGTSLNIPADARRINAVGMTLTPGLFDLHTHLPYASAAGISGDWPKHLKAYLYCGVTSVTEFGTYPETFEPMRRLIKTGIIVGPRIHFAVRMTTPHGHGAEGGRGDFFSLEVSTPREARAAVKNILPYQPDAIKIFTDGWRYGAASDMTSMNEDAITAIVDEAHKNNLEVLTHTVSLDKAKIAARAGVDVIAHGVGDKDADEELFNLMREKGTTYAPTLAVYEPRGRDILTPLLNAVLEPAVLRRINPPLVPPQNPPLKPAAGSAENGDASRLRRWATLQRNTAALRKAGIRFGTGTDAGVTGTHHGWATQRELQLLVAGGLTPLEALTAATGNAAKALHVDGERGTIAPGKLADVLLIEGAPHRNIQDIEKIRHLFLGGRELDRAALAHDIAAPGITRLPAIAAQERIDDFESANSRSRLDTRWVNGTDAGMDPSQMTYGRILRPTGREEGNHALSISGRLSEKERPYLRISVPLSRGAVEPVDARAFRGVRFDARGEGAYTLLVPTANVRDNAIFQAPFLAAAQWQTVSIDFATLKQSNARNPVVWTGADLLMLSFEVARPAGSFAWLELDNVQFYK
ncbi:MAG: CIA30 family protein [Acidobacteria bacterium]|nr:CIA30 family protein [Acidobacteriota bacterium]MBI3423375.1 CIA30 family protein [Acidobacteriota bacterium]